MSEYFQRNCCAVYDAVEALYNILAKKLDSISVKPPYSQIKVLLNTRYFVCVCVYLCVKRFTNLII